MRSAAIGFFNDHMAVGASPPERAYASHRRFPRFGPRFKFGDNSKIRGREINVRIRRLEIQAGRDLAVVNRKYQLDQTRDARRSFKVANIGFHRTDEQWLVPCAFAAKHRSQSVCFDGVTQRRTRAMRLDVMDVRGLNTRSCAGFSEHGFLGLRDSAR